MDLLTPELARSVEVVATVWHSCGPVYLIEYEKDGLLVPEGDERGFAEALWRLRTKPGLATRLGTAGREKVRRDYELGVVGQRLLSVLS